MGETPSTATSSTSASSSSSSSTTGRQPGGATPPASSSSATAAPPSSGATTVTGSSDQPRTATVLIPGPPGGRGAMFRGPPGAELVEPVDPHLQCHSRFFLGRRQPDVSYATIYVILLYMNVCTHTFIYKLCYMYIFALLLLTFLDKNIQKNNIIKYIFKNVKLHQMICSSMIIKIAFYKFSEKDVRHMRQKFHLNLMKTNKSIVICVNPVLDV